MTRQLPDRDLSKREIDLVIHIMACGAGGLLPIKLLSTGRPLATGLWRVGIVDVWQRQTLAAGRLEGPFYSLTSLGRYRGQVFATERQNWRERVPEFATRNLNLEQPCHQDL